MTQFEIQDIPNRRVEDINIEQVNEHFHNEKSILEKVTKKLVSLKKQ